MIKRKTVLVLGAGASRPYGFPVASELRNLLLERDEPHELLLHMGFLKDPFTEYHAWIDGSLQRRNFTPEQKIFFQNRFRLSQFPSIDKFLAYNQEFDALGRTMLAGILLKCEKADSLQGGWYQMLLDEILSDGPDFSADLLSVVTFNYERSLEAYLSKSFMAGFNLSDSEAWGMVQRIKIVHVYGDLGAAKGEVSFGSAENMGRAAQNIKLVRAHAQSERINEIQELFGQAERIVFLGFGFDPLNLEALGPIARGNVSIFASCLGLSRTKTDLANRELVRVTWGSPDHDVSKFLHNYSFIE